MSDSPEVCDPSSSADGAGEAPCDPSGGETTAPRRRRRSGAPAKLVVSPLSSALQEIAARNDMVSRSARKMLAPLEATLFPSVVRFDAFDRQHEKWRSAVVDATRPPRIVNAELGRWQGLTSQVSAATKLTGSISAVTGGLVPRQNLLDVVGAGSALQSTVQALGGPGAAVGAASAMTRASMLGIPAAGVSGLLGQQLAGLRGLTTPVSPAWSAFAQLEKGRARSLTQLLDGVRPQMLRLAESLSGEVFQLGARAREAAQAWAQQAYFAVMAAQNAAVIGDMEAVEKFFIDWLELPRRRWSERLLAGSDALLEVRLEEFGPDTAVELLDLIERDTNTRLRRGRVLLTDTQIKGMRVVSLESLPLRTGNPFMAAEDFLPAAPSTEDRVMPWISPISDARLEAVMGGLSPIEVSVVWVHELTGESWEAAAQACGLSASDGERVRAKLHRRARRILAAGPTGVPVR